MNSPINWYGGKFAQRAWILRHLAGVPHTTYVEPFCGAASVFFGKEPAPTEVLNDLNDGLYEFFSVLADERLFQKFRRVVEALPYSRRMFTEFKQTQFTERDIVSRAARWFYVTRQSISAGRRNWGYNVASGKSQTSSWKNTIDGLPQVHDRLRQAQIEYGDACDCIVRYDREGTLFYCDPPYVLETRNEKTKRYEHEMTLEQHRRLTDALLSIQGKAVLSGYEHAVYQPLLESGWTMVHKEFSCSAAARVRVSDLRGEGGASHQTRTECLYLSPNARSGNLLF